MVKTVKLENFSKEIGKYAKENVELYKRSIIGALINNFDDAVQNSPVDTGLYAQSWDLIVEEKRALLGNYAPHAPIIEFGARPFTPPMKPLLDWARRVLGKSDFDSNVWALATYTRNKIQKVGMEPKHVLTNLVDKIIEDIRMELRKNFK